MDDIQFGQLEESEPVRGIRPDLDKHFVVAECGQLASDDLPIFVDLDVLRDMEAHARTNTSVELGGVMLGHQSIDEDGKPFVLVTDSLRARHYEATKGSFKFTHETWSQITRERKEFKQDLEMIGWYHTHPGWSVFLSGMDMFICNNFFNRELDVALVIDPCADDRGWFMWNKETPRGTKPTGGFLLMTNRYRSAELNYFKNLYNKTPNDSTDPRYADSGFLGHRADSALISNSDNEEYDMDSRRPLYDLAFISMMFLQLLLAGLIAWKLISPPVEANNELLEKVADLQATMAQREAADRASEREKTYDHILDQIVKKETGQSGLVEELADLRDERRLLSVNLEGQIARVQQANSQRIALSRELNSESEKNKRLSKDLKLATDDYRKVKTELDKALGENNSQDPNANAERTSWWWVPYVIGVFGVLSIGVIGYFFGEYRARHSDQYAYDSNDGPKPSEPSNAEGSPNFGPASDATKKNVEKSETSDPESGSNDSSASMTFND